MRKRIAGFALAALCLWAVTGNQTFAEEPSVAVAKAASVRALQSELMVAALACPGDLGVSLVRNYNRFVRHFSPALIRSANTLRTHFRTTYGAEHVIRFDSFLTRLANQASLSSIREAAYCQDRARMVEAALGLNDADLESFTITAYAASADLTGEELFPSHATRLAAREAIERAE
ncbi:MAG: hypothetical protein J4G10_04100 [Alphaproteobacteria bacterium]|nr:hypothetical protein [Alphaproteobacteria bacterium]